MDRQTNRWNVIQRAVEDAGVALSWVSWKTDDRILIGARFRLKSGEGNWVTRVLSSARTGGQTVLMFEGQSTRLAVGWAPVDMVSRLPRDPENVMLAAYADTGLALWKANVNTGRVQKIQIGNWDTAYWALDLDGEPVLRRDDLPRNSGYRMFRRAPGQRQWTEFLEVRRSAAVEAEEFQPFTAAPAPGHVYVAARPPGRDLNALYDFNATTGVYGEPLMSHPRADIDSALIDHATGELLGVCADAQRYECIGKDRALQRHLGAIDGFFGRAASIDLIDMSDDQNVWLLHVQAQDQPAAYFIYDRAATRIDPLVAVYDSFANVTFATTKVVTYKARDGTDLWGYLTNGVAPGEAMRPLIVLPHGGPEARDSSGFDREVQFLASRGYQVFRPNFRGGGGFGRAFSEAGYRQWGKRMQDDVTDGLKHLVDTGAANAARVCIMGGSYGGYAALAGATLTPDLYKCVISIAGVSDLPEMLASERAEEGRGSMSYAYWVKAIGDPSTDRASLDAVSPRQLAAAARAPVLLLHGDADGIVPVQQSRLMKRALTDARRPVKLVEFEDEGHWPFLWEKENLVVYLKEIEAFLKEHLPTG
jgi:pimeloyl-ACP methyl ester carboxylesterase